MKTEVKVSTESCGSCGEPHSGFRVKIDRYGYKYVICHLTEKKVGVIFRNPLSKNPYQPGKWTID